MPRIYLRLLVDFDDDDKVARLNRYGRDARACRDLLVAAWRYCKREQSDGAVPVEMIGKLAYPDTEKNGLRDADRLVDVGLAERTPDGYYFPGFLKHNKSKEQIATESKQKAAAGAKGGKASGVSRNGEADTKQGASPAGSHRSEDRGQSSEISSSKEALERPETLRAVPDDDPPKNDEYCTRHPDGNPNDEPCPGCARVEERKRKRAARDVEKAARAAEAAARNCRRCDGVHITNDDGTPTSRKCDHRVAS